MPYKWTFVSTPRVGCTRPNGRFCALATFPTGSLEYSKVCGRVTGRASSTPDGFFSTTTQQASGIRLVDGVTFTLPTQFQDICCCS